jgi:integrase
MCRFTIGPTARFTVVEARDRAKALLAGMTAGIDPRVAKRAARQRSDTLQAILDGYIAARSIKDSTAAKYRALVHRNLPDWLDRSIADITPQMVFMRYEELCRRSIASANVTLRALGAVCRRAIKVLPDRHDGSPLMKRIPTEALAGGGWKTLARRTSLLEPDELPAWWEAVGDLQDEQSRRALQALLVTGLRLNELLQLQWSDVDEVAAGWRSGIARPAADADRWLARMRRRYPPPRQPPATCATAARRRQGDETRSTIIRHWHTSRLPERERAISIATRLGLSERHVRRVIKVAKK